MSEITGKSVTEFFGRIVVGTRLECLSNTYIPSNVGRAITVTRPGRTSLDGTDAEGKRFNVRPPAKVSDVVALTEDTITYRIRRDARTGDAHTATWKVVK